MVIVIVVVHVHKAGSWLQMSICLAYSEVLVTLETTTTEFGFAAEAQGFELSFLPKWSWDDSEISNIEFSLGYTFDANNSFSFTPYSMVNADKKNINIGDKIIGVKTSYKF